MRKGKKYRKAIKKNHQREKGEKNQILEREAQQAASENIEMLIDKIAGEKVSFPEVYQHGDLKIGAFYSATVQVGEEPEQSDILILAIIKLNSGIDATHQVRCLNNFIREVENNQTVEALGCREVCGANLVLTVLYPKNTVGHSMIRMNNFSWYGKQDVLISDLIECPEANNFLRLPLKLELQHISSGRLTGKKFDSLDVLR